MFGYLGNRRFLSNAHHDGTTQQIDDAAQGFETENATYIRKSMAVHQARLAEDEAWKKSQVSPFVKLLQAADKRQGVPVDKPQNGMFIKKGRKVLLK